MDHAHDFVEGLNLATGLAFGHGGVYVLNVPYLLFYPDRNRDDHPDSDPEVLLTGFGMEDAHSVALARPHTRHPRPDAHRLSTVSGAAS